MIEWFVFFLVLFLYVHIIQQYKYSEEHEVYEMEYIDNVNLQDSCQLMQPIVFSTTRLEGGGGATLPTLPSLDNAASEVVDPTQLMMNLLDETAPTYTTPMPFHTARMVLNRIASSSAPTHPHRYYSERNEAFLHSVPEYQEHLRELDTYLQPPFTLYTHHDVCIGAVHACTPFRYHVHSRKFLVVSSGKITVKMAPWKKNAKRLHEVRDYEWGEYRSNVHVWTPKEHHRRDVDKIEFLEFDVEVGHVLYVPPYWGYSIQYQEPHTCMVEYTYGTWFNRMAFLGEIVRTCLQRQHIYQTWFHTLRTDSPPTKNRADDPNMRIKIDEMVQEMKTELVENKLNEETNEEDVKSDVPNQVVAAQE